MSLFDPAFVEVMKRETPYRTSGKNTVFLPKVTTDTGGVTKWGISSKAFPSVDVANLSFDDAKALYSQIWNESKAGLIKSQTSANMYFDHAVNAGVSSAKTLARKALVFLGAVVPARPTDQHLIDSINKYPTNFPAAFTKMRILFYEALGEKSPSKYGNYVESWTARANSFFPLASRR